VQADRSHLPLKINTAGVIPPIFASSLLLMPVTITQFAGQATAGESRWGDFIITLNQYLAHGQPLYDLGLDCLIGPGSGVTERVYFSLPAYVAPVPEASTFVSFGLVGVLIGLTLYRKKAKAKLDA